MHMKTSTKKTKQRDLSFLVYGFFMVAVLLYFIDQGREGKLALSSRPSGARVYLDGKDHGKTPLEVSVKKGMYRIEVVSEGHLPFSRTITIESGKTTSLDLELLPSVEQKH